MYLGLVESPAFVNNEIVMVRNELDEKLTLIIGNNNVDDIEFDLHSNNLLKN